MSSIPTSLIVVLLVAAWLVVLVPMFARRREAVPESDDDATGFRVLRRTGRRARRRPPSAQENAMAVDDGANLDETGTALIDDEPAAGNREPNEIDDETADVEYEVEPEPERAPALVGARSMEQPTDAADEWQAEQSRSRVVRPGRPAPTDEPARDRPRRTGRGGFDPEAAEATRAYRYRTRRRVVVLLLLVTVGFGVPAYLISPVFWAGTAVAGLLLVTYLVYLRRQVRIEAEIRQRRTARLRRARQIRPEYPRARAERAEASPYRGESAPMSAAAFVEESFVQTSTLPPVAHRNGRVVVDLDDDDPAFDELETYQRPMYRRQAG